MENRSDLPYGDQPTITIVNQFLAPNPKVWSVISAHIFVSSDALNTFHLTKVDQEHPGVDKISIFAGLGACLHKPQRSQGKDGAELKAQRNQAQASPNGWAQEDQKCQRQQFVN